ncbi:MAG: SAM-dependent methyltransferase [Clostridia bacterium]|nr:SAM-dependent methyltransferase [Clostridia bacterium]
MPHINLDNRMKKIADCVLQGAVLADVGTDHGKLPIYLAQIGKIKRAVASDINEMPLNKAVGNVKKHGLEDKIETFLTNGLVGIERFSPDCVVIAGMGGELIEQILTDATIDKSGVSFVLQPMTKEAHLREYLSENGFEIYDEHIVKDRKIYQIICARYTGDKYELTPCEKLLGRINIAKSDELFGEFITKTIDMVREKCNGKKRADLNVNQELACLIELSIIKEKYYDKRK